MGRSAAATSVVYGLCVAASLVTCAAGAAHLLEGSAPVIRTLPLGLPWLGAHFRVDALSAFFLVVVNLGGVGASLFALGYGRHEEAPQRVLPFYPAFLAAMNLVVWPTTPSPSWSRWEFMSLTSWALVMAHHREPGQRSRRLHLSGDGELRHAGAAARLRPAGRRRTAATPSRTCAPRPSVGGARRAGSDPRARSARDPRRASCRYMSGCRSPTRPRQAMSQR